MGLFFYGEAQLFTIDSRKKIYFLSTNNYLNWEKRAKDRVKSEKRQLLAVTKAEQKYYQKKYSRQILNNYK